MKAKTEITLGIALQEEIQVEALESGPSNIPKKDFAKTLANALCGGEIDRLEGLVATHRDREAGMAVELEDAFNVGRWKNERILTLEQRVNDQEMEIYQLKSQKDSTTIAALIAGYPQFTPILKRKGRTMLPCRHHGQAQVWFPERKAKAEAAMTLAEALRN